MCNIILLCHGVRFVGLWIWNWSPATAACSTQRQLLPSPGLSGNARNLFWTWIAFTLPRSPLLSGFFLYVVYSQNAPLPSVILHALPDHVNTVLLVTYRIYILYVWMSCSYVIYTLVCFYCPVCLRTLVLLIECSFLIFVHVRLHIMKVMLVSFSSPLY
jgi:hypothetical protein